MFSVKQNNTLKHIEGHLRVKPFDCYVLIGIYTHFKSCLADAIHNVGQHWILYLMGKKCMK